MAGKRERERLVRELLKEWERCAKCELDQGVFAFGGPGPLGLSCMCGYSPTSHRIRRRSGGSGELCGALTGAVMAVGLLVRRSQVHDSEGKRRAIEESRRLVEQFRVVAGQLHCRALTGCDFLGERDRQRYGTEGVKERMYSFSQVVS